MNKDVAMQDAAALQINDALLGQWLERFIGELDAPRLQWWRQAQQQVAQEPGADTVARLSSQARRSLGEQPVLAVCAPGLWNHARLGRVLLIAEALGRQPPDQRLALLRQVFQWGDDQEKAGILQALHGFDGNGLCVELARQAGRTHNSEVFAALALDNPYPARHYDERAFEQMLLKALGMGLDVHRVIDLESRRSSSLNQLALDLLEEQLAADRAVSPGLAHLIAGHTLSSRHRQRLDDLYQQGRLPQEWAGLLL